MLAIIMLATYIITSSVSESTFIERERFDDPDKFIAYMQGEYDAWYDEGFANRKKPKLMVQLRLIVVRTTGLEPT